MFVALWVFLLGVSTLAVRSLFASRSVGHWWWLWFLAGLLFLIIREYLALIQHLLGGRLRVFGDEALPSAFRPDRMSVLLLSVSYASTLVCWVGVLRHCFGLHQRRENVCERTARRVLDVVLFPVAFGTLAAHSARLMIAQRPWTANVALEAADTFESWALAAVFGLFELRSRAGSSMLRAGVNQFLVINAAASAFQFFLQGFAPCVLCYKLGFVSCRDLSHQLDAAIISILGMSFGFRGLLLGTSSTVALTAIVRIERKYHSELASINPTAKFFGVKVLVSVLFVQPYVLSLLSGGTVLPVFKGIDAEWWNAWALTVETLLLHWFHVHCAYPLSDFEEAGALTVSHTPITAHVEAAADPSDVELDVVEGPRRAGRSRVRSASPARPTDGPTAGWTPEGVAGCVVGAPLILIVAAALTFANSHACVVSSVSNAVGGKHVNYVCDQVDIKCADGFATRSGEAHTPAVCGGDGVFHSHSDGGVVNCTECAEGYIGYPDCVRCENDKHCHGNAAAVTDTGRRECVCSCMEKWTGPTCAVCSEAFEGEGCDRCARGFVGYPKCTRCTSDEHCSGHAASVTDDDSRTACQCTCDDRWAGAVCDRCRIGLAGYPSCSHAASKMGCACLDEWQYCRFLGFARCSIHKSCSDTGAGYKWCRTDASCASAWDKC
eukprot:TRINITY_DN13618_c0_g1_i2.p1 TRINITY_DN13618_c0_g1~~TRINITY_DN13618_c0_g1_i2.p1  ORF type:complete len:686 (+),score=97.62 TRINITY_DN13618_c0_g1_i2:64-2058(+)